MHLHPPLMGTFLAALLAVSATFSASLSTADTVPIAFSQSESPSPDIGLSRPRTVLLIVDFAGILHIEGGMSVIAVGNPDVVAASLADPRTVILTGLLSGTTNLIALDDTGRVLADVMVRVSSRKPGMVTVRRGTQLRTYTCSSGLCDSTGNDPFTEAVPLVASTDG